MDPLDDFVRFAFADGAWTHDVYRKGEGPAVIVIHEMPGITPGCARLARRIEAAGFTVYMPSLFGTDGSSPGKLRQGLVFARLCVSREFRLLARDEASPVTDWLRALARCAHGQAGGRGVGAVGMCMTGNFALTMALDPEMLAPVLAQPSLPLRGQAGVHAAPETLATIRRRHEADGFTVLGLRFEGDTICPKARFDTLERALGPAFERRELPDGAARTKAKHPHSVLTTELIDQAGEPTRAALDRMLALFAERLR